ncbi:MAG: AAA family ATPase, partial [Chlamydiae bacterium]|nr:AAA family ATPase [Chlamydiota bacterium]
MIEYLRIKNLVLMDLCEVHFDKGLTIITGETGAGKTALTEGLKLILGERADSSMVRKGEEKAQVEARLSILANSKVHSLLEEYGIDADPTEALIITREISSEGKSRAFVNQQMVTATVLQSLGSHLIDIIGQHSYHALKSSDTLRDIVDLFGDLQETLTHYQKLYSAYKSCEKKQEALKALLLEKERNFEICEAELSELREAKLKESEEEELFASYSFHAKAQEIGEKGGEICRALTEGPRPMIRELSHFKNACENLSSTHQSFAEARDLLKESIITLQEVDHILQKTLSSLDHNPLSAEKIEERLSLYTRIKKKYGSTFQEWKECQATLENKLRSFELLDEEVDNASAEQAETLALLKSAAKILTEKRTSSASALAKKLSSAIQELNMPGAKVIIDITPQTPTSMGE